MNKYLALTILTLAFTLISVNASAEDITPIQEINASPMNFDGKDIKLKGIAKDFTRIPLIGLTSYVLEDESGAITILTDADLPKMNEEISIRARVENLAVIKGEVFGLTVIELERYED